MVNEMMTEEEFNKMVAEDELAEELGVITPEEEQLLELLRTRDNDDEAFLC
jgi:hypothetical protein